MTKYITLLTLLLLGGALIGMQRAPAAALALAQNATATPVAQEEPVTTPAARAEEQSEVEAGEPATPTLAALAARVAALEESQRTDVNAVLTAIYLLDTVGLHDLDVRLNDEGVIAPSDAGTVARINRLLSTVAWPATLAADATATMALLTELQAALADDDLEQAAPLATQAHEMQHALSHAVDHWLEQWMAAAPPPVNERGQTNRVATAVYLLDTVGLHDLDVRLNEEGEIAPADAGKVARIHRLLTTVDWPADLAAAAAQLLDLLAQLNLALADDAVDEAAPLATEVHSAQHELSHAFDHWLAAQQNGDPDAAAEDLSDEADGEAESGAHE